MDPLLILLVGVIAVIGMIIVFRVNAFVALIASAMLISLLAPGPIEEKIARVATAFGAVCGSIGIVIALAAVIGKCLMDSGAADRIVRSFLRLLGEKRAATALMGSGFILSIPVFFDTVFYLLVPLARSLYRSTAKHYVLYLTAIVAGAGISHSLVPPTPGPLFMADSLGVDLGLMILVGIAVGLPASAITLLVCRAVDRLVDVPMRPYAGEPEPALLDADKLPPLWLSLLPVMLPVVLISTNTVAKSLKLTGDLAGVTAILGNPNFALLVSAVIAMVMLAHTRGLSLRDLSKSAETALMSGGVIILITSAGGAFGAMLREAGVQDSITRLTGAGGGSVGHMVLLSAFLVAVVIKFAQGSGTVSMITTAGMFSSMGITTEQLGFNPVYLAMAIGSGSLVGDWMNNSGFWIFAKMGVLTETETLKSWTIVTGASGTVAFCITLLAAWLVPLL